MCTCTHPHGSQIYIHTGMDYIYMWKHHHKYYDSFWRDCTYICSVPLTILINSLEMAFEVHWTFINWHPDLGKCTVWRYCIEIRILWKKLCGDVDRLPNSSKIISAFKQSCLKSRQQLVPIVNKRKRKSGEDVDKVGSRFNLLEPISWNSFGQNLRTN
jgi:hypothetical protein